MFCNEDDHHGYDNHVDVNDNSAGYDDNFDGADDDSVGVDCERNKRGIFKTKRKWKLSSIVKCFIVSNMDQWKMIIRFKSSEILSWKKLYFFLGVTFNVGLVSFFSTYKTNIVFLHPGSTEEDI